MYLDGNILTVQGGSEIIAFLFHLFRISLNIFLSNMLIYQLRIAPQLNIAHKKATK